MAIPQALAKKIAEAKTTADYNKFTDGSYVLVVKRILCETKYKGTFYIPEFDIVASEKTHASIEPNRPGTDASCSWSLDAAGPQGEAQKGNIKQFVCGLFGMDESTPTDEIMKKASEFAGPTGDPDSLRARGMLVEMSTYRSVTKTGPNAGKEGCYPRFSFVEQAPEEIKKRRAQLDSGETVTL